MDWNDLRFALHVARHGGLSGAARALNSSPQTVGRRIASLEAALGVTLFSRHASGYRTTPDGEALLAEAEQVERAMAGLQAKANGFSGEIAGCVRIASPETIGTHILLPGLRPFLERHPRLQIELNTGVALIGMARGEADIAVRLVRPERGALAVRKVGTMGQGLYGLPGTRATLATDRLVGWPDTFDLPAARWLRQVSGREPDIRLNHLAAHEAAIRAGLGIGVLPHFLADGLELVASPPLPSETLWLIALADGLAPGRIRSVYEEVAELLLRWSTRLENPGPGPRVAPPGDSTSLHEETKIVT